MNYVNENVTAIKNFAEHLMPGELDSVDELKPGEGGIIRNGMSRIAACRDRDGKLHRGRRSAPISAAMCTGIRPSNAGIAPATARSSRRTATC